MSSLNFTCEEMDTISALASALPPSARGGFLRLIARRLSGYPPEVRGPRPRLPRRGRGAARLSESGADCGGRQVASAAVAAASAAVSL
jgi:hypothetical protein